MLPAVLNRLSRGHVNDEPAVIACMSLLTSVHLTSMCALRLCVPQYGGLAGAVKWGSPGWTASSMSRLSLTRRVVELYESNCQSPNPRPLYAAQVRNEVTPSTLSWYPPRPSLAMSEG